MTDNIGRSVGPNEGPNRPDAAKCLIARCGAYACIVIDGDPLCEDHAPEVLRDSDPQYCSIFVAGIDAAFAALPQRPGRTVEPYISMELPSERIDLEASQWSAIRAQIFDRGDSSFLLRVAA